jgi:hypothetical protein
LLEIGETFGMKRLTLRLSIAFLTFIISFIAVWLMGFFHKAETPMPATSNPSNAVYEVMPVTREQLRRFTPTIRGHSRGNTPSYTQGYKTSDGQETSEGSIGYETPALARRELNERLATASRIVERVRRYENRFGERGERIVLVYPPDETGKERASILWFGGTHLLYIDAPSLDLALEFERTNAYAY